jgi:hypothetical protein
VVSRADVRELAGPPEGRLAGGVMSALCVTLARLPQFSDALAASYFAHSTFSRTGRENQTP